MFKPTLKSTSGKVAGAALVLAGMVGGWSLTADLGSFKLASMGVVSAAAPGFQPGVALDFPSAVMAEQPVDSGPTETKVEQVGALEVSYEVPVAVTPPPPPAAPKCVDELTGTVAALGAAVEGIVTAEHAALALEQANALGVAANACAQEVAALGSSGMEQLAQLGGQLNGLVGTIQALPLLAPSPSPSPGGDVAGETVNPLEKGFEVFGGGLEMTLDVVNGITGQVGGLLGHVLSPTGQER